MNEITVKCTECDWITDLSKLSDSNPHHCPECGAEYVDAGTGEPVDWESDEAAE